MIDFEQIFKICKDCKIEKNITDYYKINEYYEGHCKACRAIRRKDVDKRYSQSEKGKAVKKKKSKKYNSSEKGKRTIYEYYCKNKSYYYSLCAKKRARKIQATPSWLTKEHLEEIEDFYTACMMFKIYTGLTYHVDHIIPLKGKTVCGLHVPWNLQILEASENLQKSNKLLEEFENAI